MFTYKVSIHLLTRDYTGIPSADKLVFHL
jgi:hypothetical protein